MTDDTLSPLNNVISIDDERIRNHLDRVVRGSVEETLNALLEAEADRLCNAQRYERTEVRRDTRAGHYERKLQTKAGEVRLKVPKLRAQTFETAIIERYRRRESSVEEALIEMYLAGVSVRRVEDITEALWGTRVSPSTVSDLNKKIYATIEAWRNRPIEGEHPYVYLDGIVLKRSWAGEVRNISLLVAIGVNSEGYREILGICEGAKEDKAGWSSFLKHLKERGLAGVQLIISDACLGLAESAAEFFPEARWQRALVPQHLQPCAGDQGAGDRGHAQSDPRQRGHCGSARKGYPSDREVASAAADQSRRACGSGGRRDLDLLRFPRGALAAHPHQQSARAATARDQATHARGRRFPGWGIGTQSCRGPATSCRRYGVVDQAISQHRTADEQANERNDHRLSQ
jgi:Transposase, Mutator family